MMPGHRIITLMRLWVAQEHGVFVVRDGFHVVVTSSTPIEGYQATLRACLPLKQMKMVVVMD
jgi:hypothetical protein